MDKNDVERILTYYRHIPAELKHYENMAQAIQEDYNTLASPSLDNMPRGGGISDQTGRRALKIIEEYGENWEREINDEVEKIQKIQIAIFKNLKRLPHSEKMAVYAHGIDGYKWQEVPNKVDAGNPPSVRQCIRKYNAALSKLAYMFADDPDISCYKFPV